MRILALDSSTDACSVALYQDGEVSEKFDILPRLHTQHLLPMVDELLSENKLALKDMDRLAFGCGPGSFTGLRVAASCIQGMSLAAKIPIVAVSSLHALAQSAADFFDVQAETITALLDARMNEVYCATFFREAGGLFQPLSVERVCSPEAVAEAIAETIEPSQAIVAVGGGCVYRDKLPSLIHFEPCSEHVQIHAASIAKLAAASSDVVTADAAQPVYLRNSVTGIVAKGDAK